MKLQLNTEHQSQVTKTNQVLQTLTRWTEEAGWTLEAEGSTGLQHVMTRWTFSAQ